MGHLCLKLHNLTVGNEYCLLEFAYFKFHIKILKFYNHYRLSCPHYCDIDHYFIYLTFIFYFYPNKLYHE